MAFYDSIKLEKGMYNQGLTKALESIDPSEAYEGTELSGLDAYERQLKRFNIKVKGQNSDVLESFFKTTDSAVLFPEFVKRSVLQGMESCTVLQSIVATVTNVENNDYRTIKAITDSTADDAVSEAGDLPKTTIQTKSSLVSMKKRGRLIASSYEALRHKRLDLFAVLLRKIGEDIARSQLGDAVDVLINGDESGNAAESISPVSSSGIEYADLIELWGSFKNCEPNVILTNTKVMQALLCVKEFQDVQTLNSFKDGEANLAVFGARLCRVNAITNDTLVALNKNDALEMVMLMDGLVVESDKLIDRDLAKSAVTSTVGFAKISTDSVKQMNLSL